MRFIFKTPVCGAAPLKSTYTEELRTRLACFWTDISRMFISTADGHYIILRKVISLLASHTQHYLLQQLHFLRLKNTNKISKGDT